LKGSGEWPATIKIRILVWQESAPLSRWIANASNFVRVSPNLDKLTVVIYLPDGPEQKLLHIQIDPHPAFGHILIGRSWLFSKGLNS
jgi:hypothetical protein